MKIIAAIAAIIALSGCAEKDFFSVTPAGQVDTPETTVPVDNRIPGGWYLFDRDDPAMCNSLDNTEEAVNIPCRDVLNVCVESEDGRMEPKYMMTVFRCTDESPTWRDVCRTVDPSQWPFYGYTPEECATA